MSGHSRTTTPHAALVAVETCLLGAFAALAVTVKKHPGPLPGDARVEVTVQDAVYPHPPLKAVLDGMSEMTWRRQALTGIAVIAAWLAALRRPREALLLVACALLSNDSGYHVSKLVRRPRPSDHGIRVERNVAGTFAFPSGHVVHSTACFGFILFLTRRLRYVLPSPVLWLFRLVTAPILFTIGTSRVLSGEHWPSDVLGGRLLGLAWLTAFIHLWWWSDDMATSRRAETGG